MADKKEWLVIATNYYSETFDRYRLLTAFNLAVQAQKQGFKVTIGLQAAGVECVQERFMKMEEKVGARRSSPLPSMAQSFKEFQAAGGRIIVDRLSAEALGGRHKMVEGAEIVEAGEFVELIDRSSRVLVY